MLALIQEFGINDLFVYAMFMQIYFVLALKNPMHFLQAVFFLLLLQCISCFLYSRLTGLIL